MALRRSIEVILRKRLVSVANTDPLLDPTYARAEAQRHFAAQLDAGRDIAEYGSRLFRRLFVTSARESFQDLMVIGAFLRHSLAAFDGCLLCLENGAVDAAQVLLRSQFEARLYLLWCLHEDRERWARQYYVYTLRQERDWTMKLVAGSAEREAHVAVWQEMFGRDPTIPEEAVQHATRRLRDIDEHLGSNLYREINEWFTAKRSRNRDREVDWYKAGPDAPRSIYDIACKLRLSAEYSVVFRSLSSRAHSSRSNNAFKLDADGFVVLEPVRQLADFPFVYSQSAGYMIDVCRRLLTEYRRDELPVFRRDYIENWQRAFDLPTVSVKPEFVRLDF